MGNPFYPEVAEVRYNELLLHRLKVASQGRISDALLRSVQIDTYAEDFTRSLAVRLSAEVLAERVMDTDAVVPWSGNATVPIPGFHARGLTALFGLAGGLALLTPLVGVGVFVAALLVALVAVILLALNPPVEPTSTRVPVCGDVTVPATYWRKFPEATIQYPDDLGTPVRYVAWGEARFGMDL